MYKLVLFCEDSGHEAVIKAMISKMVVDKSVQVIPLSNRGGKGKALTELERYLKQVKKNLVLKPDAIVTAIDANCKGYHEKKREIDEKIPVGLSSVIPIIHAIPDPHVERWLLLDSHAFKQVFGKGCNAPDQKCEKARYKNLLREAIKLSGGTPLLGGMEYAEEIINNMDLENVKKYDESMKRFIEEIQVIFKGWRQ